MLFSQGVVDALKYSQQDIRGTARYMGMVHVIILALYGLSVLIRKP